MLLSLLVWAGAFFAFIRLTRQGLARRALPFALLAAGPFCCSSAELRPARRCCG